MEQKKLKVGLFNDTYFPKIDGVVVVVDNYAKILNKTNDVFVACPGKGEDYDYNKLGYRVHRSLQFAPKRWAYALPLPALDRKFKKAVLEEKPDIIHIHSPFGVGKQGIKLAKKLNIPVIATMHSQFDKDFYKATKSKFLTKLLSRQVAKVFNSCDTVFTMNKPLEDLLKSYGVTARMKRIPNATDMKYPNNPAEKIAIINEKYSLKEDEKVLLFVGRLIAGKGVLFLADALNELKNMGQTFKMIFVGSGPDESELKEKVNALNLQNEVIFAGKIMDRELLGAHYLRADLFLFPSLYDNDSLVQKEAGVNKTPSVFVFGAMTAHAIENNVNGFLAQYEPKKYAERVYEILNNESLLNEVSETIYSQQISWRQAVEMAMKEYEAAIKNKKANG